MSNSAYSQLIKDYRAGADSLYEAVSGLSGGELLHHRLPEKWSIHQIAVHLADAELAASFRIRNIISDEETVIQPFDQDKWTDHLDYEQQDLALALERFRQLRAANGNLLDKLTDAGWQRSAIHPEVGELTLERLIRGQITHVADHIDQIAASLNDFRSR